MTRNNIEIEELELKKDEYGYYFSVKAEQKDSVATYEINVPVVRIPKRELCYIKINEVYPGILEGTVNLGFGEFIIENSDGQGLFTVEVRKPNPRKMTIEDVEKELGYKVEIVS